MTARHRRSRSAQLQSPAASRRGPPSQHSLYSSSATTTSRTRPPFPTQTCGTRSLGGCSAVLALPAAHLRRTCAVLERGGASRCVQRGRPGSADLVPRLWPARSWDEHETLLPVLATPCRSNRSRCRSRTKSWQTWKMRLSRSQKKCVAGELGSCDAGDFGARRAGACPGTARPCPAWALLLTERHPAPRPSGPLSSRRIP